MSVSLFLMGSVSIEVERAHCTSFLNLCLTHGYPYSDFLCTCDKGIVLRFPASVARHVLADCKSYGIEIKRVAYAGLPFLFLNLVKRPGLLCGAMVAIALLVLSGRFVWEVRVTGNEQLGSAEIGAILRENGLFVGSYLPGLDVPSLENRILISTDRLSWISINLDGTVANVQVLESMPPEKEEEMLPANLVAADDGQIEYLELFRGESVVKVGQAVKKGELLVSGIMEGERGGCRFTRASGRVMARTERVLFVKVPLSYTEKVYGEEKTLEITVNFFDFSMKIFKSTGKVDTPCDIIEKESLPRQVGTRTLPLFVSSLVARPYREETRSRTHEAATTLAFRELESALSRLSGDVQILSKSITQTAGEDFVSLECRLTCVEDIALLQEFEIVE